MRATMTDCNRGTKRKAAEKEEDDGALMNLPEELIPDVLRCLPPRYLAVCRSVCRCWRAVVDGHGLLLAVAHLVPRHVRGIFVHFAGREERHSFFSRAGTGAPAAAAPRSIDAALSFLPHGQSPSPKILDHHNGLLLCEKKGRIYVCNPVTRRRRKLPRPRIGWPMVYRPLYLVFDPTESLHFHVLRFPEAPHWPEPGRCPPFVEADHELEVRTVGSMEWPPRVYTVHVFSSRTGQWEEKQFTREDDATITTVSEYVWPDPWAHTTTTASSWCTFRRYAVYWRQELYIHCYGFVLRLSLLDGKYLVIPTPKLHNYQRQPRLHTSRYKKEYEKHTWYVYLSKSEQGVYLTALCVGNKLSVWVLRETSVSSCRIPKWELKHQADLESSFLRNCTQRRQSRGQGIESWMIDPREQGSEDSRNHHEWDSDDDDVVKVEEGEIEDDKRSSSSYHSMDVLGYHPYKEIVFLGTHFGGYAYFLGSSKLEFLGSLYTTNLLESFIYTPCMDDLLPTGINNDP